ncbi:UbiA-like polyprenyltransferase [Planctomicrobium piriforme]|uniref:4-hydroxybenzoate polyprenyltransferase n=1 Tax=Planctomicrobium piriforme TaxID=1576369 RepID=A0A1I3C169_9PLAN|nr:UbiA-like polyprenyltransferase [Planctomicrobium piriforme]SFH68297.1 4-hydroxybenzoate polyprenyltransferase [Planctomicrobium piriforme]
MTADTLPQSAPPVTVWKRVTDLLGLIRFSHTVFALPFALLSALLAWQTAPFHPQQLAGIVLCMVFARSAAMAFNRLVDRDFDAQNPRTAKRHLPAGQLSVGLVTTFTILCSAGFIASTLCFLPNPWPLRLSVPVLLFLLSYSYAKRFTALCHYWLSAALMLSPLAAWIAITGGIAWPPVWLAAVIFFWVGGFDILYATQDAEFDRTQKLHSLPSRLGVQPALRLALASHLITIACLFAFWKSAGLGPLFLAGAVGVSLLLIYEHWLVRPNDLSRVNVAFFNINAVISLGLLAIAALDLWIFPKG